MDGVVYLQTHLGGFYSQPPASATFIWEGLQKPSAISLLKTENKIK
jgi:hypothetical protein